MAHNNQDELRMFDETISRFVKDQTAAQTDHATLWAELAQLGILAMAFDENSGGLGMGLAGSNLMMQSTGLAHFDTPYLPWVILSGTVLDACPSAQPYVQELMEGTAKISPVFGTFGSHHQAQPKITAQPSGGSYQLNGSASDILALDQAQDLLVAATITGSNDIAFFLVPVATPGLTITPLQLVDGRSSGKVNFDGVSVHADMMLLKGEAAQAALEKASQHALIAVAAQNLGAMKTMFTMTLDYAKIRKQFGRAIGTFQSLQFRLVDMWVKLEEARALVGAALRAENTAEFSALASAAWIQTIWSGRLVSEEAVQIHGGIGMTDECEIGQYMKMILTNEYLFGSADYHLHQASLKTRH